jgi:4-hydroxy-tetrahydrodipicolinate synthase
MRGARSRNAAGTRSSQRPGGSFTWLSAEMSWYPLALSFTAGNFTSILGSDITGPHAASVFAVGITPFDAAGGLDEAALRGHLRRMAAAGIGVYVGGGGSGEGFVLAPDERRRVLEVAAEELAGKVPFRSMGVETRSAAEMIGYARMAQSAGVDAAQIYSLDPGHGHLPTPDEVLQYLIDVLAATTVPAVLSTHQSVGYRIPVDTIVNVVDRFDQVIGVNCSHADLGYLAAIVDAVGDKVAVHVGGPLQALSALALGANGFLSSEANLAPRLCASVIAAYEKGAGAEMLDAFGRLARLSMVLYGHGGIRATKAVLNRLGLPGGYPRKPQLPVTDATVDAIMAVIDGLQLGALERWPAR